MMETARGAMRCARAAVARLAAAAVFAATAAIPPAASRKLSELAREGSAEISNSMVLVSYGFWLVAFFVAGWAVLRFKAHVENPQRGGLAQPVVGILVAVALASTPALIDLIVESFGLQKDPQLQKPKFQ